MDDPESTYSHFSEPLLIGALQRCRSSYLFNNTPWTQETLSPQDKGILEFMVRLEQAYQYQLSLKKEKRQLKNLPPVPRFEDSEIDLQTQKKVKMSNNQQVNALSCTTSQVITSKSMTTQQSATQLALSLHHQASQKNQSEVICEEQAVMRDCYSIPTQTSENPCMDQKNQLPCKDIQSDLCMSQEFDNISAKPSAKPVQQLSYSFSSIETNCSAEKEDTFDKKDLKKLKKFESCLREYLQKLSITDSSVERKFLELLRLVVPKLSTHFKSKPFEAIAAAILLYACREVQHPITIKQITQVTNAKEKLINKCIFSIKEILPNKEEIKHFHADEFILVIGDKIAMDDAMKQAALRILQNIESLNFIKSNHAATLACCCIKFACALSNADRGFDEIAEAASINKMTLRNMYRELFPYRFRFITSECHLAKSPSELPNV